MHSYTGYTDDTQTLAELVAHTESLSTNAYRSVLLIPSTDTDWMIWTPYNTWSECRKFTRLHILLARWHDRMGALEIRLFRHLLSHARFREKLTYRHNTCGAHLLHQHPVASPVVFLCLAATDISF